MSSLHASFAALASSVQALLWGVIVLSALLLCMTWLCWRQGVQLRGTRHESRALQGHIQLLHDRHELLDTVAQQLPMVPYRCEAHVGGAVLFVGEAIEGLTGWPAEEFTVRGKRLGEIVHPDDLGRLRKQITQAFEQRQSLRFECRLLHRNGHCLWVNGHCDLRRKPDGSKVLEGAFLNVQERKQLEQTLHEREHLYSSLIANIPGVAYRCTPDANWTVLFISDMIEQLSGWTPADYHASPTLLREFIHVDDQAVVHQQIQDAIAQGRGFTLEYRAMHRDGRQFWAWEQGNAVHDAHGTVVWLDGVIIDISERKATEIALRDAKERAEEAAASKTMFLANMGHEVRTPLNAIIGFSEVVLRNDLDAMQRQYVFKVRQAAHALLRMMNDILDMSRLERGQLTLASHDFSLFELAQEALQAQRSAADKKGVALLLETDPALGEFFHGDAVRLRQVLDKLLDNAVKFTERGSVRLQLAREQGQVLLAVHDTGIGIAPERQERIFEAFTQGDASSSRRFGGTGLGTTLAQQLTERMGGCLTLQSEPGKGSVFRVLVPVEPVAPPAPAPSAEASDRMPLDRCGAPLSPGLQPLQAWAHVQPWGDSLRQAIDALRSGEHADATLPVLLQALRGQGLTHHAAQVEHALAMFDLDRAAELLETLPARL